MVQNSLTIRATTLADLAEVDALLSRSYTSLLRADYPPSVLVTALPLISRAQPDLLASGSYFVAVEAVKAVKAVGPGAVVAAGGWTAAAHHKPGHTGHTGHIRHVVTDKAHVRRGIGRQLMIHVLDHAKQAGMTRVDCLSTRTAVPFYASLGFKEIGPVNIALRPGIDFPVVAMERSLE